MRIRVCAVFLALTPLFLAGACSSGSGDPDIASLGGTATPQPTSSLNRFDQMVRYAQCLREQGLQVQDPTGSGDDANYPRFAPNQDKGKEDAAAETCKALRPPQATGSGTDAKNDLVRRLATCMRDHGVENYPDPGPDGLTRVPQEVHDDPQYAGAKEVCDALINSLAKSMLPSPSRQSS
jgi:hypothetical protein